jgi:hypothetical protein
MMHAAQIEDRRGARRDHLGESQLGANPIDLEASYNEDSYNYFISITKTTE